MNIQQKTINVTPDGSNDCMIYPTHHHSEHYFIDDSDEEIYIPSPTPIKHSRSKPRRNEIKEEEYYDIDNGNHDWDVVSQQMKHFTKFKTQIYDKSVDYYKNKNV